MNFKTNQDGARSQRGFVTIYVTLASMLLIPLAGLAIDCSVLYTVKARLQAACDAGAVGAGYKLQRTTNMNDATQIAAINNAALRYFNANYPSRYWGSTQVYYSSTPSEDSVTHVRSIYVHAEEQVPMLFLRVVGVRNSLVAAQATTKVRYIAMMIVVDRSGSVVNGGADGDIQTALTQFVSDPTTSSMTNNRDYVGMVSFGGNWKLDYAPVSNFQTSAPNIGNAINNIPFDSSSSTNTAEGLYQGWYQLKKLNQVGALNVIVLLTDGRPSAFTGQFTPKSNALCTSKTAKSGVMSSYVGSNASEWPPPQTTPNSYGIQTFGLLKTQWSCLGCELGSIITNSLGCLFALNVNNLSSDIPNFPATAGPVDNPDGAISNPTFYSTTGPVYVGEGTSSTDPRAVRYAAFNVADNMATAIRTDTTLNPILFVIGLNESSGEPLDADWLARVANDPNYSDSNGNSVFQGGQTSGKYYNVSASGLSTAFQQIASQVLRISQ